MIYNLYNRCNNLDIDNTDNKKEYDVHVNTGVTSTRGSLYTWLVCLGEEPPSRQPLDQESRWSAKIKTNVLTGPGRLRGTGSTLVKC